MMYAIVKSAPLPRALKEPDMRHGRIRTSVVKESGLELDEAKEMLLDMYNHRSKKKADNWGVAVCQHGRYGAEAQKTDEHCLREFKYDGLTYSIKRMDDEFNDYFTEPKKTSLGGVDFYLG